MLAILLITAAFGFILSFRFMLSSESMQVARLASLSYEEGQAWWGCLDSEVWGGEEERGIQVWGWIPTQSSRGWRWHLVLVPVISKTVRGRGDQL